MFRNEILSKTRWICLDCVWFAHGVAGCIGLAYGFAQMYFCEEAGMQGSFTSFLLMGLMAAPVVRLRA